MADLARRARVAQEPQPGAGAATDPKNLEALRTLLGADSLSVCEIEAGRIRGRSAQHAAVLTRLKWLDGPLFDLIGKLTGKPCRKLLGEAARFTRGHYSVPDAPGLGLAVDEKVYDSKYRQKEIAVT